MFYNDNEHSDIPTTERIPVSLMTPFLNKGHILFSDNFYNSPSLATFFLEKGTLIYVEQFVQIGDTIPKKYPMKI